MQANIVPTTAQVIARIESSGNPYATRFERKIFNAVTNKGIFPLLTSIKVICGVSYDTARVIYSTSYGLYQIMGFNLYSSLGIKVSPQDFMNDKSLQDKTFSAFIVSKGIDYSYDELKNDAAKRNNFSIHYNGSEDYANSIIKSIASLNI